MALVRTQVVIVGAGMVGLSFAIALAEQGREVVLVEQQAAKTDVPESLQLRVSALSQGSQDWLQKLGVWNLLPQERLGPYQAMQVWDKDAHGKIAFNASEAGQDNLGHIVENAVVEACLWQRAATLGVRIIDGVNHELPQFSPQDVSLSLSNGDIILAQLLIAADGANSSLREQAATPTIFKDYEQQGVVALIKTQHAHEQVARQVFLPGGPLALLPMQDPNLVSIVWTRPTVQADQLCAQSEIEFNKALTAASDNVLGTVEVVSERRSFPLRMRYAERWVHERQVLMGDAAHTIHPLAGQGANLGLADAKDLAHRLSQLGTLNGVWESEELARTLRSYQRARKAAAVQQISAMEGFHQLFRTANPLVRWIRSTGLNLVNSQPLLKNFFLSQASK